MARSFGAREWVLRKSTVRELGSVASRSAVEENAAACSLRGVRFDTSENRFALFPDFSLRMLWNGLAGEMLLSEAEMPRSGSLGK